MKKSIVFILTILVLVSLAFATVSNAADEVTIDKITVNDGSEAVLKAGDTLKIEIKFTGNVTCNTQPKLSLKIGNDYINDILGNIEEDTITYSYTVIKGYKGEISDLMSIGTLKDTDGNTISMTNAFDNFSTKVTVDSTEKTDFTYAKYELKKDGRVGATLEITNITPPEGHTFVSYVKSSSSDKPAEDEKNDLVSSYDKDAKKLVIKGFEKYVEQNKDMYLFIYERGNRTTENQFVLEGKKIERFEEPKYTDAFFATFMTSDSDQIITNFTHDRTNSRKFTIYIGKITNNAILQKIKNKDSSGMSELLEYARTASPIATQNFDSTSTSASIDYDAYQGSGLKAITVNNVEDKAYYYLYVKGDTESGKYINQEAVTFALSSKHSDGKWSMFFYDTDNFQWTDLGTTDSTVANKRIPNTGKGIAIITALALLTGVSVALYKTNEKYKGI